MSNETVFNTNETNLKVTIYGDVANVPLNIEPTGAVDVVGTLEVVSTDGVAVGGVVNLTQNQVVGIKEYSVIAIGGHTTVQVVQSINVPALVVLNKTFESDPIDVSTYSSYNYYVKADFLPLLFTKLDIYTQVCHTTNGKYVNSPNEPVTITKALLQADKPGILANIPSYMKYARLSMDLSGGLTLAGTIQVVFVGQY